MADEMKIGTPWRGPRVDDDPVRGLLDTEFSGFAPLLELADDSNGDDRSDLALKARYDAHDKADALTWLLESAPAEKQKSVMPLGAAEQPGYSPSERAAGGPPSPHPLKPGTEFKTAHFGPPPEAPVREFVERLGDVADDPSLLLPSTRDLALGFSEMPRQVVGGLRDAVQNTDEVISWFDQYGADLPIGRRMTKAAWKRLGITQLPEVGKPYTVAGSVVRSVTQMVRPYVR
jgi:hypothetical protein